MATLSSLFSGYRRTGGEPIYTAEFDAWRAMLSYSREEKLGDTQWVGAEVAPVLAEVPLSASQPMQHYFVEIARRVWQKATPSHRGVPQRAFLAQTRQPSVPPLPSQGPRPAFVSPTGVDPAIKGYAASAHLDLSHLDGVASDWTLLKDIERINAYTFRGDGRSPEAVKAAGGFTPNSERTDDYYLGEVVFPLFMDYMKRRFGTDPNLLSKDMFRAIVKQIITFPDVRKIWIEYSIWRAMEDQEKLHLGRMLANEALKGYISTTRAVGVAKGYACKRESRRGWVYLVLVEGGMVVPPKMAHVWTSIFGEQEIAYPGALPWDTIYGFRLAENKMFIPDQPLYLRKGFQKQAPTAFKECYALLSGKPQ